jgi:hypothetical protein
LEGSFQQIIGIHIGEEYENTKDTIRIGKVLGKIN